MPKRYDNKEKSNRIIIHNTTILYSYVVSDKGIVKPIGDHVSLPFLPNIALSDFETGIQNAFHFKCHLPSITNHYKKNPKLWKCKN